VGAGSTGTAFFIEVLGDYQLKLGVPFNEAAVAVSRNILFAGTPS
jgi:hypothetical protein